MSGRLKAAALAGVTLVFLALPAAAEFPQGGSTSDPYAYHNYMFMDPYKTPNDLGGDEWKYSSKDACQLYGSTEDRITNFQQPDPRCNPLITANPQELHGVTGASIDRAWEMTTGRPDVVIAVHDSGVMWNRHDRMRDLAAKTWLNQGELPEPDWGTRHPRDPDDRNHDGVYNIKDYCPVPDSETNCGGTGDSRVIGNPATDDTDFNRNSYIDPEDLIFLFSDGVDSDRNGYKDDMVGWDSYEDDNDPFDEVQYGHGTGEAQDSTGEINNGTGEAGTCPNCLVMHMRVGDSFIADVNDFAEGVVYATDNGASVLQSALGTLNNSRFAQEAIDYAWRRGVVLIASAADESAGHHNQPSVLEHGVTFNAIGEPRPETGEYAQPSFLAFRGCTNYGAYITASVPANSCSSEAVGRMAGVAGLMYAEARNELARKTGFKDYGLLDGGGRVPRGHGLSAEEVDQIVATTADDLDFHEPLLYTYRTMAETERYPATDGWDPFFGYGRINARRMVEAVRQNKVPPEADITSPRWFETIPGQVRPIEIRGSVAARRAKQYSYKVEWAVWSWRDANAPPAYTTDGVTLTRPGNQKSPHSGVLARIDSEEIRAALRAANGPVGGVEGPAVDPVTGRGDHENRQLPDKFGVIARVVVTAKNATGAPLRDIDGDALTGIGVKNFNFHVDPQSFTGFPKFMEGDGAAAPRFADLDDDGVDDLIVATSNGEIHAYKTCSGSACTANGEVAGWPVKTTEAHIHYGAPAYKSGEITTPIHSAVLRSPAVGDIDRDGDLEVVAGDFQGRVTAWNSQGKVLPGFPVRSNPFFSAVQRPDREAGYYAAHPELSPGDYPWGTSRPLPNNPDIVPDLVNRRTKVNRTIWWFLAAPTLANLDQGVDGGDPQLEIVAGAGDRHAYAWHHNGAPVSGWPVFLRDPGKMDDGDSVHPVTRQLHYDSDERQFNGAKVVTSPAVGDLDGDGKVEVVLPVNEQYQEIPNTDDPLPLALYLVQVAGADIQAVADALGPLPDDFTDFLRSLGGIIEDAGRTLSAGNNRIYAIHGDGSAHGTPGPGPGGHPNPNAFVEGWPARVATMVLEILPVVGNGPTGAPVIAEAHSNPGLEIGTFGTAGPAYLLNKEGRSVYGSIPSSPALSNLVPAQPPRDRSLAMQLTGAETNSPDVPSVPAVGGPIFTRFMPSGAPSLAVPAAGLGKLVDLILPEDQLVSDNHLSVWELQSGSRAQHPAFPREVNDLQFLSTAASADVDGDGLEEVLAGTAYSDLHAFNYLGQEPGLHTLSANGWPKFTGGWTVAPPAAGDFDGNGKRDIAHVTREGNLFLWHGNGALACGKASWPEFGHDGWNTNNADADTVRPRVIRDLKAIVSGTNATVVWTAPGDDGSCGSVTRYEVRTSTSPITSANFDSPANGSLPPPSPVAAGTTQSISVERPACGLLYVSVRSFDDAGNPSAVARNATVQGLRPVC